MSSAARIPRRRHSTWMFRCWMGAFHAICSSCIERGVCRGSSPWFSVPVSASRSRIFWAGSRTLLISLHEVRTTTSSVPYGVHMPGQIVGAAPASRFRLTWERSAGALTEVDFHLSNRLTAQHSLSAAPLQPIARHHSCRSSVEHYEAMISLSR